MSRNQQDSGDPVFRAGHGYPTGQLQRALEAAGRHKDPKLRARAEQRALVWEEVLSGIASGSLTVGSRTPVADTPAWVTLEVVQGGFATGRYVAEGPIEPWENELLQSLPGGSQSLPQDSNTDAGPRHQLNAWYLSDDGLAELWTRLANRTYSVQVPEEGALLVVAWMMANGFEGLALDLVASLYPLIDRLRFYPRPVDRPVAGGAMVHLRTAGEVAEQLKSVQVPQQVEAMNSAHSVWNPLRDRLLQMWLSTYENDWPCQLWPETWPTDRKRWLAEYANASAKHPQSRHLHQRSTFQVMRDALERCPTNSADLSARDVGRLRQVVGEVVARHGAPGTERHERSRLVQQDLASLPTHREIAGIVADRLDTYPSDGGVANLSPVLEPVEIRDSSFAVPSPIAQKTQRTLEAPIENLVEAGVIGSAEVLAQVVPQISSQVAAAGIEDPELRHLYSQIYQAFRSRRSLLLLNLEHQVQLEELPWVAVLDRYRKPTLKTGEGATQTLSQLTMLGITSFPQTIFPNPFVRELAALANSAEIEVPFVEEIATDIFMGTFTKTVSYTHLTLPTTPYV